MKTILITGGAGFIGSNLVAHLTEKYPDVHFVNLDALTYAGSLRYLAAVESRPNYTFVQGNINDQALLRQLFARYDFQGVYHLAAESHVGYSIENPAIFIESNINGTFALLQVVYQHWMSAPFTHRKG